MRAREPRTTCALVTMAPSLDQIIPEPSPRFSEWIRTVARSSCSAISPNPVTAILLSPVQTFANQDANFLYRAATNKFHRHGLADCFAMKLRLNILELRDLAAAERNQDVPDDDSRLVRWPARLNIQNNRRGLLVSLERLTKRLGQPNWLYADAQITTGNPTFFQ